MGRIKKLNRKLPVADYDYETSHVSVITSTTPTPTPTPANQAKAQFFLTVLGEEQCDMTSFFFTSAFKENNVNFSVYMLHDVIPWGLCTLFWLCVGVCSESCDWQLSCCAPYVKWNMEPVWPVLPVHGQLDSVKLDSEPLRQASSLVKPVAVGMLWTSRGRTFTSFKYRHFWKNIWLVSFFEWQSNLLIKSDEILVTRRSNTKWTHNLACLRAGVYFLMLRRYFPEDHRCCRTCTFCASLWFTICTKSFAPLA